MPAGEKPAVRCAIVSLDAFKKGVHVAQWLGGTLERVTWVRSVKAQVRKNGEVVIAIMVEPPLTVMRKRCLPTACDRIRTEVREG